MLSCNVPVPSDVARLATDLAAALPGARARTRGEHTLVAKRLPTGAVGPDTATGDAADAVHRIESRLREALAGTAPFEARVAEVDRFEAPTSGSAPVVYLAVESAGLVALHDRLCDYFPPVEGLEGEDYDPHVTVARGGDQAAARDLADREIDPIEWTVETVTLHDAKRHLPVTRFNLPL
ncbi:MAG: 2'-5' RNA ligase family protein [Haloarculaceae archaeon]